MVRGFAFPYIHSYADIFTQTGDRLIIVIEFFCFFVPNKDERLRGVASVVRINKELLHVRHCRCLFEIARDFSVLTRTFEERECNAARHGARKRHDLIV